MKSLALRIGDIVLNEQYGEGSIPSNTKTGGGPILLTSSFTYVRDWINKHPFKNEPNARLICNLYTGHHHNLECFRSFAEIYQTVDGKWIYH